MGCVDVCHQHVHQNKMLVVQLPNREKLVLGLPWYGYSYPCEADARGKPMDAQGEACQLKQVPFHGAPCSDAAGAQLGYADVMKSEWCGLLFGYAYSPSACIAQLTYVCCMLQFWRLAATRLVFCGTTPSSHPTSTIVQLMGRSTR